MAEASSGRLRLRIVTHDRLLLEETCDEVGLPGRLGDLGILPGHTAMIANLRPGELFYKKGNNRHRVAIDSGFCELSNDVVSVLVEEARLPEEIDVEAAREEKAAAEAELLKAIGPEELLRSQDRLDSAEARLSIAKE